MDTITTTPEKLRAALDAALPNHAAYGPVFERLLAGLTDETTAAKSVGSAKKVAKRGRAKKKTASTSVS